MTTQSALLLLHAETPLHAGSGQSVAGIDLPIQREAHSHWPCVYGSSVKGALRAAYAEGQPAEQDLLELFGPEHSAAAGDRDKSHAGALLVGDARLLLLPVRSLQSCFKWVTCTAVLKRYQRDAERMGIELNELDELKEAKCEGNQALSNSKERTLFLEEFRLESEASPLINKLAEMLAKHSGNALRQEDLKQQLVLVSDDIFTFLASNATAINAHIAIDSSTKTVKQNALWYEESLPPESLLYVPLTATQSRHKDSNRTASEMFALFREHLQKRPWLQLGGNETTGMGWCKMALNSGDGQHG